MLETAAVSATVMPQQSYSQQKCICVTAFKIILAPHLLIKTCFTRDTCPGSSVKEKGKDKDTLSFYKLKHIL